MSVPMAAMELGASRLRVRLAHVLREERVPGDGRGLESQSCEPPRANPVQRGSVLGDHHACRFELLPEAYCAVTDRKRRAGRQLAEALGDQRARRLDLLRPGPQRGERLATA